MLEWETIPVYRKEVDEVVAKQVPLADPQNQISDEGNVYTKITLFEESSSFLRFAYEFNLEIKSMTSCDIGSGTLAAL